MQGSHRLARFKHLRCPAARWLVFAFVILTAIDLAAGQSAPEGFPGAGAVAERSAAGLAHPTHGWVAIPAKSGATLVHVPPRRLGGWADRRAHGAPDGTARRAMDLEGMPVALGAIGERVYFVLEQGTAAGEPLMRSVCSILARPSAVGGYWYFEPEGRLNVHASLPASGVLRAVVGTPAGLAAHIEDPAPEMGNRVFLLRNDRWADIPLPTALRPGQAFLMNTVEGVGLLVLTVDGVAEYWTGVLTKRVVAPVVKQRARDPFARESEEKGHWPNTDRASSQVAAVAMDWKRTVVAADGSLLGLERRRTRFFHVAGLVTYVSRLTDGAVVIGTVTADTSLEIARFPGIPEQFGAIPLDAPGRIALTWVAEEETTAAKAGRSAGRLELREVSVFTGRVLYSGPGRGDAPVSKREVQLLAGVLVGLMAVVLFIVLRRDTEDGRFHLPRGTALAEPGRRFIASLLDLALVLIVSGRLWEMPLSELLVPVGLLSGQSLWVMGTALGLGLGVGTISEWFTGRTLGKLVAGCEVIDVAASEPVLRHPRLWQCLVRNAVKWMLPPVAVLGLMDSESRHRGDAFARSAVIIRVEEPADTTDPEA